MSEAEPQYLTTREVAELLRIRQKKVYALVAEGELPAARISGKWLFPRALVERWVSENTVYPSTGLMGTLLERMLILQGSDDLLLSAAIDRYRDRCGGPLVSANVGSVAGLSAVASGSAHLAGYHVDDSELDQMNAPGDGWFAIGLMAREQGLVFRRGDGSTYRDLGGLDRPGLRLADRQPESGTHRLARRLLREAGVDEVGLEPVGPFSSHIEVCLAVRSGMADVGFAIRAAAEQCGVSFMPLFEEPYKLAVPAAYMSNRRVSEFLDLVLDDISSSARTGVVGYSFESLGRIGVFRAGK